MARKQKTMLERFRYCLKCLLWCSCGFCTWDDSALRVNHKKLIAAYISTVCTALNSTETLGQMCMYMCVCAIFLHACVYVHARVSRPEANIESLPLPPSHYFFWSAVSTHPALWLTDRHSHHSWPLHGCLRSEFRSSFTCSKYFTRWTISLISNINILTCTYEYLLYYRVVFFL